ncbi:DUF6571 family protein [Streptomyces sp. SYSU K217416]
MLTFDDVYNAPVDKLKTAADDWSEMVTKLETLADDARTGMQAKASKADWRGVNADVTKPFIQKTAKEFDDAAKEAKGIQVILVDGHTEFKKAKDDLKKLVDEEAPAQGLKIDGHGKVSAGYPLENDVTAKRDPDYPQALEKQKNDIAAMQRRVDRIVEDCGDVDDSLARALRANVTDDHNFSGPKYNSLDDEQVDRAAGLVKKVTGEGGTARNVEALKELEELMDDNRNDPEFATAFYRKLGAEGALEAYTKMSLDSTGLGPAGQDRAAMVHNIQNDMGSMLGIATSKDTKGHLDAGWTNELLKAGRKQIDVSGFAGLSTRVYGYQALGSLLREGKYDTDFLTAVGRDMVAMERKNPQIWEEGLPYNQTMAFNQDKEGGKGFYPLTGLMEAMSNNPEASTAFFNEPVREDSNGDGIVTKDDKAVGGQHGKAQGMVDYMLDKKPTADWHDTTKTGEPHPAQTAVGHALEAAVSGQARPYENGYAHPQPHTDAMANVMERVVAKVGDKPELMDSGLSGSMGRMSAEYIGDINAAYGNDTDAFENDRKQKHATFEHGSLTPFMDALGRHDDSYATVSAAQHEHTQGSMQYAVEHVQTKDGDMKDVIRHIGQTDGTINGVLAGGRIDGALKEQFDANDEYNKDLEFGGSAASFTVGAIFEAAATRVPIAGELAGWAMDETLNAEIEEAKKDPYEGSAAEVRERYLQGLSSSTTHIEEQVKHLTLPPGVDRDIIHDVALDASKNGYSNGLIDQRNAGTNHDR